MITIVEKSSMSSAVLSA